MSESERVPNRSEGSPDGQRISRRLFVRNMTVVSAAVLAGSSLLEGCSPSTAAQSTAPTALPPANPTTAPAAASSATLSEALKNRRSANAFRSDPLPKEKLLDLLWAAWGINRPDSGKRTAPSAGNTQEIDLYVLLADGAYVYDAKQNQLTPVSDQDLRAKTGAMKFKDAPVHLVFVADYAKYKMGTQSEKELWSSAHTGFIGQNVYLYCAAEGLGAHFYAGLDRAVLKDSLKLRTDQAVVFGQAVGYPNE
jgi:SagB-type dehydrogenase family enzyme